MELKEIRLWDEHKTYAFVGVKWSTITERLLGEIAGSEPQFQTSRQILMMSPYLVKELHWDVYRCKWPQKHERPKTKCQYIVEIFGPFASGSNWKVGFTPSEVGLEMASRYY